MKNKIMFHLNEISFNEMTSLLEVGCWRWVYVVFYFNDSYIRYKFFIGPLTCGWREKEKEREREEEEDEHTHTHICDSKTGSVRYKRRKEKKNNSVVSCIALHSIAWWGLHLYPIKDACMTYEVTWGMKGRVHQEPVALSDA